ARTTEPAALSLHAALPISADVDQARLVLHPLDPRRLAEAHVADELVALVGGGVLALDRLGVVVRLVRRRVPPRLDRRAVLDAERSGEHTSELQSRFELVCP